MKKKNLFLTAAAIGTIALSLTVVLNSQKVGFLAKATESPYAIANDEYEVAIMEQFNNGTAYGYSEDKPLGNNSLAGHMYGSYENGVKSNKEYDLKIGVNEELQWKFSAVRANSDTTNRITSVQKQVE